MDPINFSADDIRDYEVTWQIEPQLTDPSSRSILSYGKIMQITRGSFSENTDYTVTLTVTNIELEKLSHTKTVYFSTLAPPNPGNVQLQPASGLIGDEFSVVLREWTSDNPPITYNVYNTYDIEGTRKGLIINTEGPIPIDDVFKFEATRVNPVIVTVTDSSQEILEFTLAAQISEPAVEPEDEGELQPEDTPTPQNLLAMIQRTENTPEKVSFMNTAIAQSLSDPSTINRKAALEDIETQILFRKSIFEEIEKEIRYFAENESTDMSIRDFLFETIPMIKDLTGIVEYMDKSVVEKASQVIYQLT